MAPYTRGVRSRRPRLHRIARAAGAVALAWASTGAPARSAEAPDAGGPFELSTLDVPGRPLDAWSIPDASGGDRLIAASVEGSPPDERRHLSVFAPGPAGGVKRELSLALPPTSRASTSPISDRTALPSWRSSPETASRSGRSAKAARRNEISRRRSRSRRRRAASCARRSSAASRMAPALRPSCPRSGASSSFLSTAAPPTPSPFPSTPSTSPGTRPPACVPACSSPSSRGPRLATGNDDGDGRPDLFALSRYDVAVYRSGPEGLPAQPSRRVTLRPFTDDEELRYLASSVSLFARDLDGDGLADLVQHRTFGTLLRSHATTNVWRNRGGGADPTAPPDAQIEGSGGFGSIFLEDLDGDGRLEAVQLLVPFGAVQLVRAVLTDTVQARLRVFRFAGPALAAEPSFADDVTIAVETREGRVAGVLPTVLGDFDGDGLKDLAFGESLVRLVLRLGVRGTRGPGFGPVAARQAMPAADRAVVGDFDGDGLDDLAAIDTRSERGVALLRNRGALGRPGELRTERPAREPELRPAEEPAP